MSYAAFLKASFLVFLPQLTLMFFAPTEFVNQYRFPIVSVNLIVSGYFGWKLYRRYYHLMFRYDDEKFSIRKGNTEERTYHWADFVKLSVATSEYGEFMIRLYGRDGQTINIPVEKLKLDPFKFRPEVLRLLGSSASQASIR